MCLREGLLLEVYGSEPLQTRGKAYAFGWGAVRNNRAIFRNLSGSGKRLQMNPFT